MAQPFRAVHATFWTGRTGKQIRAEGPAAQAMALYAITSPHANMIGHYNLPLQYIQANTGWSDVEILATLRALEKIGFLRYDPESEWLWVCAAVKWQVGDDVKSRDKRVMGVRALYHESADSPFQRDFYNRYGSEFGLDEPAEAPPKPLISPSKAPCITGETETETETETDETGRRRQRPRLRRLRFGSMRSGEPTHGRPGREPPGGLGTNCGRPTH